MRIRNTGKKVSHNIVEYLSGCMAPVIICMMLNPEKIFKVESLLLKRVIIWKKQLKMKFSTTVLLIFCVENCTWIQRLSLVFCPLGNFRFLHVGPVHLKWQSHETNNTLSKELKDLNIFSLTCLHLSFSFKKEYLLFLKYRGAYH